MKIKDDQEIDSPWTLASFSVEDITAIFDAIRRTDCLVSGKIPDKGNQISILAVKNLKLVAFMLKWWNAASKHVDSTSVLQYQHQREMLKKKTNDTNASNIDNNK